MKKPFSALVGLTFALAGFAPVVHAEVIEEALVAAYANNPSLAAQRAALRSTDESVPQTRANWRPTVTASAEGGPQRVESNTATPRTQYRTARTYTVSVSQPLFRGGRTIAAIDQAENNVLAGRANLASTEQDVLLDAATAFMDVVRDESVVALNINNEQVLSRQLEAAEERFRVGEITRTDVSQAEARLARAVADRVAAEGALQTSRAAYLNAVGLLPEKPVAPPPPSEGLPASLDEALELARTRNPNVVSADYVAKAAYEGIDLVRGELLPTLSLDGGLTRNIHTSTQESASDTAEAVLSLSVPIYEGGAVYARLRAQKHVWGQRRLEADQARRNAVETASQSWENLQSARARKKSFTAQIKASETALEGVQEEARVGSRTVLDVLDAEQELFDGRVNLVRAQRDEVVAAYQLQSAVGYLTAQGLNLPVELYNPTDHYDDVRGQWFGADVDTVETSK